ncbi:SAM-dependent methyltransferase [Pseudonocardia sp. TRM90224]|uniref:SAM-dependent methyltransferase n=1 Tax=Pseudonocardia sp. TRM90224 TaxID=2812678 RepID=UPI001E28814C|nr:SAM-dependent methyltransferase [Pseudonocardia sp. TRM90224]
MTNEPPDAIAGTGIDASIPHSARIWNYWLGGKDNYAVDRTAGDAYISVHPDVTVVARASRAFLTRSVTHLARDAGIRQFLDVGTGLPTADNTHEIAQRVAPDARIVYVDNDPLVLAHARALLTSTREGATRYLEADMHEPEVILAAAREVLDFDQPIALMFMGVLGHIGDLDEAKAIVRTLLDPMVPGSYLVINDGTDVIVGAAVGKAQDEYNDSGAVAYHLRTPEQIASFFDGLEIVEPGILSVPRWRPEVDVPGIATIHHNRVPDEVDAFGGVGRKP